MCFAHDVEKRKSTAIVGFPPWSLSFNHVSLFLLSFLFPLFFLGRFQTKLRFCAILDENNYVGDDGAVAVSAGCSNHVLHLYFLVVSVLLCTLQVAEGSKTTQFLFKRSLRVAHHRRSLMAQGKSVSPMLELQHRVLDKVDKGSCHTVLLCSTERSKLPATPFICAAVLSMSKELENVYVDGIGVLVLFLPPSTRKLPNNVLSWRVAVKKYALVIFYSISCTVSTRMKSMSQLRSR